MFADKGTSRALDERQRLPWRCRVFGHTGTPADGWCLRCGRVTLPARPAPCGRATFPNRPVLPVGIRRLSATERARLRASLEESARQLEAMRKEGSDCR